MPGHYEDAHGIYHRPDYVRLNDVLKLTQSRRDVDIEGIASAYVYSGGSSAILAIQIA